MNPLFATNKNRAINSFLQYFSEKIDVDPYIP